MTAALRIAYTSDLHGDLGPANAALLPELARALAGRHPDVLVVAGDVAEHAADVEQVLADFADVAPCRLYVPGNHDLFAETTPAGEFLDSARKHAETLPAAAAAAGFRYLSFDPVTYRGVTFVGTPGWYDGSLADPGMTPFVHPEHYRRGWWRGTRAYDAGHVLWPTPAGRRVPRSLPASVGGPWAADREIHDAFLDGLRRQLECADPTLPIVAVVHVLAFRQAVRRGAFGSPAFLEAGLGSSAYGACLRAHENVRAVILGHQHRPLDTTVGNLRVVARPVGNAARSDDPPAAFATQCFGLLTVAAAD